MDCKASVFTTFSPRTAGATLWASSPVFPIDDTLPYKAGTSMTDTHEISHVSDTALWVAALRAREQERPDAAFQDPLADMLAGIRGRKIAASMPRSALVAWAVVVRTTAIDQLIHEALALGIDSVLNLGAGQDTRAYRLNLPARLRWIEVDFPHVVEFKDAALREYRPACGVERVGLNL